MSLRHAVLGFLSVRPFTGYDLKKTFDDTVRHFWSSDKAALYRMLAELEREGLAISEVIPQDRRPDRHLYSLTEAGRAELDRWLRSPLEPPIRREPFLIQVFFSDRLTPEERDALLSREIAAVEVDIAALRAVSASLPSAAITGPLLSLHAGLTSLVAWRDWLKGVLGQRDPALTEKILADLRGA